ncbi:uncharacterized protein HD556DRAFT_919005 [Suillus plorans]|uniref:Uncharacterized protein n=1 Tax=Suillus plorans TaxID=116603 RepID=A0A9P7DDL8_9AGAM|nr:uncharacterized protein HD556DRAFT_919005 [Suillus plorans]KAG1788172.1 hypothetical protein HD556DRAFT_919005 [Suillus plorans]
MIFKSLLMALVPPACTRIWGTSPAAEFQNLYGPAVANALPVFSVSLAIAFTATRAFKTTSSSWISEFVDDVTYSVFREAEPHRRPDAYQYIDLRHAVAHSTTGSESHRKTLANHVERCALYRFHTGASVSVCQILAREFGVLATECLSQEHAIEPLNLSKMKTEYTGRGEWF